MDLREAYDGDLAQGGGEDAPTVQQIQLRRGTGHITFLLLLLNCLHDYHHHRRLSRRH